MDIGIKVKKMCEVAVHGVNLSFASDPRIESIRDKLRIAVKEGYETWPEIHKKNLEIINKHLSPYISALSALGKDELVVQEAIKYNSLKQFCEEKLILLK
jgi:hypothetical protein